MRSRYPRLLLSLALTFSLGKLPLLALTVNSLFSDYAVLQQDKPIPVWGSCEPGETVSVTFGERSGETKADETGKWIVILDPLAGSMEPRVMKIEAGDAEIELNEILVGEVWIGSGQSNMAWPVRASLDAGDVAEKAAAGGYPRIRLFKVPVDGSDLRASSVNATWVLPTEASTASFSATAFYFAVKLAQDRNVPVGMIQSANGGTNAFSWINSETLASDPAAETVRTYWAATLKNHPAAMDRYKSQLEKWSADSAAAKEKGEAFTVRAPREPLGAEHVKRPAGHYNAMIAPLQPYAIRGVIWYQGEANSRVPFNTGYNELMQALVEDWRTDWAAASGDVLERTDFPFYLVQLPNFGGGDPEGWPLVREQMLKFWKEGTNTGMVVTIDTGDPDDIHPANKTPVGERLAQFARANTYGENIVYSGPIYDSLQIEGSRAILSFTEVGGGLVSLNEEPLAEFEIAGADGEFVPAVVSIQGDELAVTAESIPEPRAVRYAWKSNPEAANFGNEEGLPASPFRTDSW
ncbi:MAG: sialate O-acetylesterase [Verrucomicrobiales bacterium]|nr:sialate O-acetylesterase [Verrucomicrobiales bacterium]